MSKIVYNPKFFQNENGKLVETKDVRIPYGARIGLRPDAELSEQPKWRVLKRGEYKKFRDDVAVELLDKYVFLRQIDPKDLAKVMKEAKDKEFKCDIPGCIFETDVIGALEAHKKIHKLSPEAEELLKDVPEDEGTQVLPSSVTPRIPLILSEDNKMGIPNGGTRQNPIPDKDSSKIGWYGNGLENDYSPTFGKRPIAGSPGQF